MAKQIFTVVAVVLALIGMEVTWAFDDNKLSRATCPEVDLRKWSWRVIFPGTKWCGDGNIAKDYDDLGVLADTDKCCRAHDHCNDSIEAYKSKHNLTNPSWFTRLSCACDEAFHKCLREVHSTASCAVGGIYFTLLGTQCFREDYPAECVEYKYNILLQKRCVKYKFDTSKPKLYQWFDEPFY